MDFNLQTLGTILGLSLTIHNISKIIYKKIRVNSEKCITHDLFPFLHRAIATVPHLLLCNKHKTAVGQDMMRHKFMAGLHLQKLANDIDKGMYNKCTLEIAFNNTFGEIIKWYEDKWKEEKIDEQYIYQFRLYHKKSTDYLMKEIHREITDHKDYKSVTKMSNSIFDFVLAVYSKTKRDIEVVINAMNGSTVNLTYKGIKNTDEFIKYVDRRDSILLDSRDFKI